MSYPLVEVVWIDATAEHSEVTIDSLPELTTVSTVGFLVKRDDDTVWVAQEILESKPEMTFRCTSAIPAPWVKSIRVLERKAAA